MARPQAGLSVLELLVVCAIAALLAGLTLPGATRWLAEASAERTLHRLHAALARSRHLAVVEGLPVVLCPLDEEGRCDGAWSEGYAIFRDPERRARLPPGAAPVRVFRGSEERVVLRAFRSRRYFRFLANGQTDWQNGRFVVCPRAPDVAPRSLVVQGRTRSWRPPEGDPACD